MRWTCAVLALGTSGLANASYELMLIPSIDNKVHRYDPANNMMMGSFSAAVPSWVVAQSSTGQAWVGNGFNDVVRPFNYSTGFATDVSRPFISTSGGILSGTRLLSTEGSFIRTFDTNTFITGSTAVAAGMTSAQRITELSGNRYAVIGFNASKDIVGYIANSALTPLGALSTIVPAASVDSTSQIGGATVLSTGGDRLAFTYRSNLDNHQVRTILYSSTALISSSNLLTEVGDFDIDAVPTIAPTHDGFALVGMDPTGLKTRVQTYASVSASIVGQVGSYDLNFRVSDSLGVGMVVAPEPGTIAALGVGLVAILRKRRR